MDLRQLRHFAAVAEELHFGRAAETLGMTQPPLSQSIQRLESELGVRLFERTHRHVALTAVGAELLPHALEVLAGAERLPALAQELLRGVAGRLRLAFVSTADYGVLPDLMRVYGRDYPRVAVELLEATLDVQVEAMVSGRIDAGLVIGAEQGSLPGSIDYLPLERERLLLALPGDHESAPDRVRLESVASNPLIIFPRRVAPSLHDAITGCFADRGLAPVPGQEAIQMQTIVSLVSAGLGIAIVPESLRNLRRAGVRYVEIEGEVPSIETGLIWRRTSAQPTVRNLVRIAQRTRPAD